MSGDVTLENGAVFIGTQVIARAQQASFGIRNTEMARDAGLRGPIVANLIHFAQLNELLLGVVGPEWLMGGEISVEYRSPLYDGDGLIPMARVLTHPGTSGGIIEFELWCENQDGRRLAWGTARCPTPHRMHETGSNT